MIGATEENRTKTRIQRFTRFVSKPYLNTDGAGEVPQKSLWGQRGNSWHCKDKTNIPRIPFH